MRIGLTNRSYELARDHAPVLLIFCSFTTNLRQNAVYFRLVLLFIFVLFNHFLKKMLDKKVKKGEYKGNRPFAHGFIGRISLFLRGSAVLNL